MGPGDWAYSTEHRQPCRILDVHTLWDQTVYTVWLSVSDALARIPHSALRSLDEPEQDPAVGVSRLLYIAAAARIIDALSQNTLLAPLEASVIPLPHQLRALSRAVSADRVRYLLADEVGLGKTIEAGLIMRELKLRGLVRRTLVVAPKGLVTQWVSEMRTHFNEPFRILIPGDFVAGSSDGWEENRWSLYDQVVTSMDSVKPLDKRRGWSRDQLAAYNRARFDDLISAGWDLIIVDEAHRLGGSTEQVARHKLGQGLADAAPFLLLLSATPHQGKTDAFHRLVSLLDAKAFPDVDSLNRTRLRPYLIRTEKRQAIDVEGNPLFKPRSTRLVPVSWEARHTRQHDLYEAVTDYVREGYNRALKEKKSYVGFLMVLLQRLVTSSTRAIRATLERRLDVLRSPEDYLTQLSFVDEDWSELDAQQQLDLLVKLNLPALRNEQAEVSFLLDLARQTEAAGPDAKAEALLACIYHLQAEESDPNLKVLIFTEFVPTQEMLRDFLLDRGFTVEVLNGAMDIVERRRVQDAFATAARILISTDAGGEGLNLQFCHVVINYDLPWNPMKIEQRIGRVDRIGQSHPVRAVNFVLEDTVEYRVREVLEQKLAVILHEFGVDKTGDVLDSAQAEEIFDDLYIDAILDPERITSRLESLAGKLREHLRSALQASSALSPGDDLDPSATQQVLDHPLPYWVERMTVAYLHSAGGTAAKHGQFWELSWPNGEQVRQALFSPRDAAQTPTARAVTLEDPRVRSLLTQLPPITPEQPIPCISIDGLASEVHGVWSLWRVAAHTPGRGHQRVIPLFLHDNGRIYFPSARHIWDQLLSASPTMCGYMPAADAAHSFDLVHEAAEQHGRLVYEDLLRKHKDYLAHEREKGEYAFEARRRAIARIGLPAVRQHRLTQLAEEEQIWRRQLDSQASITPELVPILIVRIVGDDNHA